MAGEPLSPFIEASGTTTFEQQKIFLASGVFGVPVTAFLSSVNASVGFGQQPHRFSLEYIPDEFTFNDLPPIGTFVRFNIGDDFHIAGRIKHSDYSKSSRGNILSIDIEDIRDELNDFTIDTYGIFGENDSPAVGVIDVIYWYCKVKGQEVGRQRVIKDLNQLRTVGASYGQIYEAVQYFENTLGTINGLIDKLPPPEVIDAQLPRDPDAYRFQFKAQPFLDAVSRILKDIAYDFYYDMKKDKINVVNRRFGVEISEDAIPTESDTAEVISLRYGNDEAERSTVARLYGGNIEGLIGPTDVRLMPSGSFGNVGNILGVNFETNFKFIKGWSATLKYFGPDGNLNSYQPTDDELAASLKGLEWWARSVGLDNRIDNATINSDTGLTVEQRSVVGSGLGLLRNRRVADRSWIVNWYSRVRTFAQNHYGRTYVLDPDSQLYGDLDQFDVVNESWCNLENQTDGGTFDDNYKISDQFKFLAPFYNHDTNKMRAYAVMPPDTKWGLDGEQVPAAFEKWNEDEFNQFVPIEVKKWDSNRNKFTEDFLEVIDNQEKGILVRLPQFAWSPEAQRDLELNNVFRIQTLDSIFDGDTTDDIPDPLKQATPFQELDPSATNAIGACIPVKVKRRFGIDFPDIWASGTGTDLKVEVVDSFVPWSYEPRGSQDSNELLNEDALAFLSTQVVNRNTVTFAEVVKVGLPVISFDNYSNQSIDSSGNYGTVSHGITNISLTKDISTPAWQTKYSLKSHFPQFVTVKPIQRAIDEDFSFAIKRIDASIPEFEAPEFTVPPIPELPETTDGRRGIKADTGLEHTREIPVEIISVRNPGANQYYLAIDSQGTKWPRALDVGFGDDDLKQARATDGFLQFGMDAVYHIEKRADGTFEHYFTGGVDLKDTKVVEISSTIQEVEIAGQRLSVANVKTLPTTVTSNFGESQSAIQFEVFQVPFLDQQNIPQASVGDKFTLVSHGNKNRGGETPIAPDSTALQDDGTSDVFLVNATGGSNIILGQVTTRPDANNRNGAIKSFTPDGGATYADGEVPSTGGSVIYNVIFAGADPSIIEVGDPCTAQQFLETATSGSDASAQFRLIVLVSKPTFFGGITFQE